MSAPIRNEGGIDDPLSYAPRWARASPPELTAFAHAPPTAPSSPAAASTWPPAPRSIAHAPPMAPAITDTPAMAPGVGGPNIDLPPPRLRPFEGDIAVRDLRRRLALEPDIVLESPMRRQREPVAPWIGRLLFVLILAAIVAFCVALLTLPQAARPPSGGAASAVTPLLDTLPRAETAAQPARLVVESQRAFANEPLPLGVSLQAATGWETVTLVGLAKGTKLTAGTPLGLTGWQVAARDLGNAFAHAPKDFVGIMDAAIDLRSPRDRIMDSQIVRLEWVQKKEARPAPRLDPSTPPPLVQQLDPEEIAMLIRRAEDFLKTGDLSAARLFLRRAAGAGHAQAALVLGLTFDPAFLAEQGALGFAPDLAQARSWYERAVELGSSDAARRLERLARK